MPTYDAAAAGRALARLKLSPLDLDDADLAQLEIVNPALVTEALIVRNDAAAKAAAPVASAPLVTKAAPVTTAPATPPARLTVDELATAIVGTIAKAKAPLVAEIAELKRDNVELKARVLELEAAEAPRRVPA
jgi:hypothetical protein